MTTTIASTSDIQDRFRELTPAEIAIAPTLLADAMEIIVNRRPNIEADLNAGRVSEGNLIRVLCAMVIRVLRNPDGLLEESIDDYRYRRDAAISSGTLHVTAAELDDLTPTRALRGSVRLVIYGDD